MSPGPGDSADAATPQRRGAATCFLVVPPRTDFSAQVGRDELSVELRLERLSTLANLPSEARGMANLPAP